MNKLSRRAFLRGSAAVVAAPALTPGAVYWFEKFFGRLKLWDFGAARNKRVLETGLVPIKGHPGLFRDRATGGTVYIREYQEVSIQHYLHATWRLSE